MPPATRTIRVHIPRKLAPLTRRARYKGAHGGRGGAKSHFFAEQLVLRCYAEPTRAVCIREVQDTIKESVRQLLVDKIHKLGLESEFQCLDTEIRGPLGSLIIFRGMQSYNAENIKSLEGYDIAWVEEAQSLSAKSWRMLRPTIRKPGSEIWCSWNPRHDTDPVDEFFRGPHKSKDAICVEVNWPDNPWFPSVLHDEMSRDYAADPEMAEHVWGGGYEIVSEGAYFARLIAQAEKEGRIGDFRYNPSRLVRTSWDLGVDDYTAIWFWQDDGLRATVIDYYEVSGDGADEIVAAALPEIFIPPKGEERWRGWSSADALNELKREKPYRYGEHFLPHDIAMREWGAGGRSRILTVRELGLVNVKRGVATNPADRIEAARQLLPITQFTDTERVMLGLKRLRRYSRKFNDAMGTYTTPLHDDNSHGADAFGEFAMNCGLGRDKPPAPAPKPNNLVFEARPDGSIHSNMSVREIIEAKKRQRNKQLYG